jgi:hypothetical protein
MIQNTFRQLLPPRFKIGSESIGVYSVHLKSNLITHGDKQAEAAKNIQKREVTATQLVAHVHDVIETAMLAIKGIVIGAISTLITIRRCSRQKRHSILPSVLDTRTGLKNCPCRSA